MRSSMIRLIVEERGLVPIQDFIFLDYGSLRTRADCRLQRVLHAKGAGMCLWLKVGLLGGTRGKS